MLDRSSSSQNYCPPTDSASRPQTEDQEKTQHKIMRWSYKTQEALCQTIQEKLQHIPDPDPLVIYCTYSWNHALA